MSKEPKKRGRRLSGRWCRLWDDFIDDPKVQTLASDRLKIAYVNLLCVASKNHGEPFDMKEIAFRLRLSTVDAAAVARDLSRAGLLDEFEGDRFLPHNWHERQSPYDQKDPTHAKRKREYRSRLKAMAAENGTVNGTDNSVPNTVPDPVPEGTGPVRKTVRPESEQNQSQNGGGGGDARAGAISQEAIVLARDIAKVAGFETPLDWPVGWHGAALTVDKWLSQGWNREIIRVACEQVLRRSGVPDTFVYFEKPISRAVAQHAKPLPVVKTPEGETIYVQPTAQRSGSPVTDASADLVKQVREAVAKRRQDRAGSGTRRLPAPPVPERTGE